MINKNQIEHWKLLALISCPPTWIDSSDRENARGTTMFVFYHLNSFRGTKILKLVIVKQELKFAHLAVAEL